jgi:hypothetical protein
MEEEKRKEKKDQTRWMVTFVIWFLGLIPFKFLWEWRESISGGLGDLIEFVIFIIASFYFVALAPIRKYVGKLFGDKEHWSL